MSCAPDSNPILIAGAGPTGLVLAISLLKQGVPVRLIDKGSTYRVGYKGSGIMPRSLELYHLLGFLPTVLEVGAGQVICKTYLPNGENCQEAALRDHLEKNHGFNVELGTELVSFEQHDNGVKARLLKMTSSNGEQVEEIFDTPYLVGADGAHSVVRKQLGLSFLGGEKFEITMVVGDIWAKGLDNIYWHTCGDRTNGLITMRAFESHDGRFNFMVAGKDVDTALSGSSREGFIKTFENITGRTDIEFGELIWLSIYTPKVRMINKFSEGRAFVVGDACHIHSPMGGQGLNTGIPDAFNLGWKLGLVHKGLAPPRLLDSYSLERAPVVAAMLDKTTELTKSAFALRPGDAV
ncbi:FAD binding domain-containing protein [Mucidula mucida]|nr:FAD binding domain-containing protein [Mucidula mucida]